jgi:hypothetical protein
MQCEECEINVATWALEDRFAICDDCKHELELADPSRQFDYIGDYSPEPEE